MQSRTVFPFRQIIGWALACLAMGGVADAATPADPEGAAMLQSAWQQIAAVHANEPSVRPVLRVVYFVPRDREPLADHAARLDRVMKDVRFFPIRSSATATAAAGITHAGISNLSPSPMGKAHWKSPVRPPARSRRMR